MVSTLPILREVKEMRTATKSSEGITNLQFGKNAGAHSFDVLHIDHPKINLGNNRLTLKKTFQIHCGDKLCFVGRSGSGKSTLALAIMGLYQSTGIKWVYQIGGLTGYPPYEVFGYSGQKPIIFDGTIFENVTLKNEIETTPNEIQRLLEIFKALCIDYLITKNNGELHQKARLSDLSGGELQRLSLARIVFLREI
jgi:ATP-binding cassette subfamily C protein